MKYFTAEEVRTIIGKSALIRLCYNNPDNPNAEAMQALFEAVLNLDNQPMFAAVRGFVLGYASGVRKERARRKEVQA